MSSSVPEASPFQATDARAQHIELCQVAGLTGLGLLGPAHALFVGGTGTASAVVYLLLTGVQAFAVFSIISAIFVVRKLKKDTDLDPFVVCIPTVCCSVASTLLVIATCVVHWKAACGIAVVVAIFLLVVHRGTVIAFGKRLANWNAMLFTRVSNTVLTFGGWLVNERAMLLTSVGNTALPFRGWLAAGWMTIASRLRAPAAGGSDLEMGVGNGNGE